MCLTNYFLNHLPKMKKNPKPKFPKAFLSIGQAFCAACQENDRQIAKLPKKEQQKIQREAREHLWLIAKSFAVGTSIMDILEPPEK